MKSLMNVISKDEVLYAQLCSWWKMGGGGEGDRPISCDCMVSLVKVLFLLVIRMVCLNGRKIYLFFQMYIIMELYRRRSQCPIYTGANNDIHCV